MNPWGFVLIGLALLLVWIFIKARKEGKQFDKK